MNIEEFIVDYLQREYTIPEDVDIKKLNFVDQAYIDSLGMINFIVELEDNFGITFTDEEIASEEFKVVGTLTELIEKKLENK